MRSRFAKVRVHVKLLAGFGAVLFILAGILGFSMWQIDRINRSYTDVVDKHAARAHETQIIHVSLLQLSDYVQGYVLTGDSKYLQLVNEERNGLSQKITTLNGSRAQSSPELMNRFLRNYSYFLNDYVNKVIDVKTISLSADPDLARAYDDQIFLLNLMNRGLLGCTIRAINDITNYEEGILNAAKQSNHSLVSQTYIGTLLAGLLALAGGGACAYGVVSSVTTEIGRRREAEQVLQNERDITEAILDTAGALIVVRDANGHIIRLNHACEKLTGFSLAEVKEKRLWEQLFPPEDMDWVCRICSNCSKTQVISNFEKYWVAKDGTRYLVAWSNTAVRDNSGGVQFIISAGIDVTERKRIEETLRRTNERLEKRVRERTAHLSRAVHALQDDIAKRIKVENALQKEAAQREKTEKEILQYQKNLRSLASEMTIAEERERRRISSGLHDHLGQNLAVAKMRLQALQQADLPAALVKPLKDINQIVVESIDNVRHMTFQLSPPILYELGLKESIIWLAEQMQEKHGIKVMVQDHGLPREMDDEIRVLLFHSVRELFNNIVKYAQVKSAAVSLGIRAGRIYIAVEDRGVGFDFRDWDRRVHNRQTFGLFSIQERLTYLGGRLNMQSEPGRGTRVDLTVPARPIPKGGDRK